MKDRAGDSLKFMLIWELPLGIYEAFMKSFHSLLLPEKSYGHLKIEKKKKKIEKCSGGYELGTS